MERAELIAANRANWNARAVIHRDSAFYDIERFVRDPDFISDVVEWDEQVIGDVAGLDLLHLQCHIGTDSISWARSGANVTGLDFSDVSLQTATDLARRAGDDVRFVCADVLTADRVLRTQFDIVYASCGVLCWIPSFEDWARAAVSLVKPGGRFYLRDGHAMQDAIDYQRTDGQVVCVGDYFGDAAPYTSQHAYTYTGDDIELTSRLNFQWTHPLSKIVQTLIDLGMRIDALDEMDWVESQNFPWMVKCDDGRWRFPDGYPRLPLSFSVLATKA